MNTYCEAAKRLDPTGLETVTLRSSDLARLLDSSELLDADKNAIFELAFLDLRQMMGAD